MKKVVLAILVLVVSSSLVLTSCKKEKAADPAPTPAAATPVFSATVNGTGESWSTYYYQLVSGGTYINAFTGAQQKMQLVVGNAQVAGTYTIGGLIGANYWDASNTMHAATSGTITISSIGSSKISGTYSFNASSTTVTSGVFTDIPLQ